MQSVQGLLVSTACVPGQCLQRVAGLALECTGKAISLHPRILTHLSVMLLHLSHCIKRPVPIPSLPPPPPARPAPSFPCPCTHHTASTAFPLCPRCPHTIPTPLLRPSTYHTASTGPSNMSHLRSGQVSVAHSLKILARIPSFHSWLTGSNWPYSCPM